ncbi:hypothetical protein EA658_13860 [Pseudoxanthomonas winnipegensis]|uniref:Uncharacterized protein n=1 Tax=Pseudoxanthomonas winnipegensis TaxID=2480810 RepID=A0ABY1WB39_9GAMM|nr:hypothetical protein [Pseudoxanthomonas winnipegensis]TAA18227.1 hypothetical protein EA658_13860 [Pseudoxanthomonas winnipegensis]
MKWSPNFPMRKGRGAPVLQIGVEHDTRYPHVWAGVSIAGQTLAFSSTSGSHQPLCVPVSYDCICIGMHAEIERGQMKRIVQWLRTEGVEVEVEPDSPHAADLAALTVEAGEGTPA